MRNLARSINVGNKKVVGISRDFRNEMQIVVSEYMSRLEDDFNMPEALAEFHSFVKFTNTGISDATFSLEEEMAIMDMFDTFNQVLGIIDFSVVEIDEQIDPDMMNLLTDRNQAKLNKDFELADKIRDELLEAGYKIIDGREGSILERV
jgi:cysteinyl-tRNA synthetase